MHRARVYVDTSVFGGTQDEEFTAASCRFFDRVKAGEYHLLVSQITLDELLAAPESVRQVLDSLPEGSFSELPIEDEVRALANAYVAGGALGRASLEDASHVAAATVGGADLIVSWNFRHLVNYTRIQRFNAVNLLNGYRTIDIRSPREVTYGDSGEDV